jgi:hypothetical protein
VQAHCFFKVTSLVGETKRNWQDLAMPAQIERLMSLFGNFHDACLREMHVVTGHYVNPNLSMHVDWRTTVHMLVQRQYAELSAIELRFEEVVALHVCPPPPDSSANILSAALFLRDGVLYWADNSDWTPESPELGDVTWVAARKASWRDAGEWLGPNFRYRGPCEPRGEAPSVSEGAPCA